MSDAGTRERLFARRRDSVGPPSGTCCWRQRAQSETSLTFQHFRGRAVRTAMQAPVLTYLLSLHTPLHNALPRAYGVVFMKVTVDPIVATAPKEIPLEHAPLERVIAQIRFPEILSIEQRDFVAPFQEALRATYPVLRQEHTQAVVFGQAGVGPSRPQVAWRFSDTSGDFRVSLTPEFVALETTRYASRSDFLGRLREVAEALAEHFEPAQIDRLGVRYVDRITGAAVDEIAALVRPEVRGIAGTSAATHATHALSESMFDLEDARILARWGQLPANATVDPGIEPAPQRSWILDLDMFSAAPMPFAIDRLVSEAERYAERIYTLFRWAVTDEFIRRYGGTP